MSNVIEFQIFLTKMCCCTSLKTGTLIIGSIYLVASIICFLASIGLLAGSPVSATILQYEDEATPDICHLSGVWVR